jgi:hypothetical protein
MRLIAELVAAVPVIPIAMGGDVLLRSPDDIRTLWIHPRLGDRDAGQDFVSRRPARQDRASHP